MAIETWRDKYVEHPMWTLVSAIRNLLDSFDEQPETDATQLDHLDRVRWVMDYLAGLQGQPSLLVSPVAQDNMQVQVAQLHSYVQQWFNGPTTQIGMQSLEQASATAAGIGDLVRSWAAAANEGDVNAGLVSAVDRMIDRCRAAAASAEEQYDSLKQSAAERTAVVNESAETLRVATADFRADVDQEKVRIDAAISEINTTFLQAEQDRSDRATAQRDELKNKSAQTIDDLEDELVKAKNLVNAVGLAGTSTEYGKYAKDETSAAFRWSVAAVFFFAVSLGVFLYFLVSEEGKADATPWQAVSMRVGSSVALIVLGGYCARESLGHRQEAKLAKGKQLDLAALDPFIVNLPPVEGNAIKAAAARRLFTPEAAASVDGDALADLGKLLDVHPQLKTLLLPPTNPDPS